MSDTRHPPPFPTLLIMKIRFKTNPKMTSIVHLQTGVIPTGKEPDYMSRAGLVSRATSVCRDDFQSGVTWGEPARLMADAMNRGKPEWAWFCTLVGLMSRAGRANAITWKNLSPVSQDSGNAIPGSRLTGLARLSCNREVDFYCV